MNKVSRLDMPASNGKAILLGFVMCIGLLTGGEDVCGAEAKDGMTAGREARQSDKVIFEDWTLTSGKSEDTLLFSGLDSGARYELELGFLAVFGRPASQTPIIIGQIAANGRTLAEQVAVGLTEDKDPMPPAQRWFIPAESISDGKLEVQLQKMEAAVVNRDTKQEEKRLPWPFAIHVKLLSADPVSRPVVGNLPSRIQVPVVRLTPRPEAIADLDMLKVDLGGQWSVYLNPPLDFWKLTKVPGPAQGTDWIAVKVPGELGLQVPTLTGDTVAYCREFAVPEAWRGQRIKLKCDAIFNEARIWINGVEAGTHVGNFTPFELDITGLAQPGQRNMIAVEVKWNQDADRRAVASAWVGRRLMGILRKIYLFTVPEVNVADIYALTTFDKDYRDAILTAKVQVVNESAQAKRDMKLRIQLRRRGQPEDALTPVVVGLPEIPAGKSFVQDIKLNVPSPAKWDTEHPNLYDLGVTLVQDGHETVVVKERIGFRQIEIRGNQVFINNHRVRYRGVNWAENDALRGVVLSGDDWRRDVSLLQSLNCNYIRTILKVPVSEELVEACDELGMFLSSELPVCWSSGIGAKALAENLLNAVEIVMRDRNRPSVIQWSLGNELGVDQNLQVTYRLAMKPLDSSRPFIVDGNSARALDFITPHYSLLDLVEKRANHKVPVLEGEFAHPDTYNREEHYTDPGMRDLWGYGVARKWEMIVAGQAHLGGSIWFGIDDWFVLPDGGFCGWGEWGMVDIWRRVKPEGWSLKKIFSPVHITTATLPMPEPGQPLRIPVENRHSFSDLNECRFEWTLAEKRGTAAAAAQPGAKGTLEIAVPSGLKTAVLELKAYNPQGLMLDAWRINVGTAPLKPAYVKAMQKVELVGTADRHVIRCGEIAWTVDARSGKLLSADTNGKKIEIGGPELLILQGIINPGVRIIWQEVQEGKCPVLNWTKDERMQRWVRDPKPLTAPCSEWTAASVTAIEKDGGVEVTVEGSYAESEGRYVMSFTGDGGVSIGYDFKVNDRLMPEPKGNEEKLLTPRQLGLVFDLPQTFDQLSWRRNPQWTYYPQDHIGRPEGTAKAFPEGVPILRDGVFYRTEPSWPWSLDTTPQGSADFRSTKANIYEASLTSPDGSGVRVISDGSQHARAWVDASVNRLLVADVNREQNIRFFRGAMLPSPTYKPGDHVRGTVKLHIQQEQKGQ